MLHRDEEKGNGLGTLQGDSRRQAQRRVFHRAIDLTLGEERGGALMVRSVGVAADGLVEQLEGGQGVQREEQAEEEEWHDRLARRPSQPNGPSDTHNRPQ